MKVIQRVLKEGTNSEFYFKHLSIINNLLPVALTAKEIKVLAAFMSADKNLTEDDMFNGLVRKKVMKELNLSPGGLSNYIRTMINKGFIQKNKITKRLTVKDFLFPKGKVQGYQIKLVNTNGTD